MTAVEVMPANTAALAQIDPANREAAVTMYLAHARDQLALAVQATGPEVVAALKAQIATAAEATKQLGLSREIQSDAQEMVRRAEYALGKAIRAGQERGEIRTRQENLRGSEDVDHIFDDKRAPSDFASKAELSGNGADGFGIYAMTDGVTDTQFDAALDDARVEGNLSRANVIRKIKGVKSDGLTPLEKLRKVRELSTTGMTSEQIAKEINSTEQYVRNIARQNSFEITADKVMNHTRRGIDSNHIVNETVTTLDGLLTALRLVKFDDLDMEQADHWATSLSDSLRALNRFAKQIKEMTQ